MGTPIKVSDRSRGACWLILGEHVLQAEKEQADAYADAENQHQRDAADDACETPASAGGSRDPVSQ
jgi:hypothetical protein